jgi:DNA polymerase I
MLQLNTFLIDEVELPFIPVVADIEDAGYMIDRTYFNDLRIRLQQEQSSLLGDIRNHAEQDFNPNSPDQVRDLLFTKLGLQPVKETEAGNYSVDDATLTLLEDKHPVVPFIRRHRHVAKLISTYCNVAEDLSSDGRLHVEFNQLGAETGRLTSRSIIQTLPKDDDFGIRKGFVAPAGKLIVGADFKQQELCVLAGVSGDKNLQDAIAAGLDLHGFAAIKIFGLNCEPNDVKKLHAAERERIKAIQFGIIYGKSCGSLARDLGMTREAAQQLLGDYFKQFPDVKTMIDDAHQRVRRDGYVDDLFGRRRYLPDAKLTLPRKTYERMTEQERKLVGKIRGAERQAQNHIIQGASATVTKLAMIRCHKHIRANSPDIRMILTLHDEVQFEVPEHEVAAFAAELPDLMCNLGLDRFDFRVPLTVDVKVGPSWGRMQPYNPAQRNP